MKKKRIIFIILVLIMTLGLTLGAGYFIYNIDDSRANVLETGLVTINFTEGENINLENTVPVIDEIGLTNDPYEFSIQNTSKIPVNLKVQFIENDTNTLPIGAVRYGFYINSELIQKGSLVKLDEENNFLVYENFQVDETINCKLVLWVDYYYDEPNQTFGGKIKVVAESSDQIYIPPTTAAEEIMAKVGTDGLVAINTDGGLYSGTGTIREYRYSGTDVNNYVYFNCKDSDGTYDYGDENYDYASNCETWRIVGVFEEDGEQVVKIMRNTMLTDEEVPKTYMINGVEGYLDYDMGGRCFLE